MPLPNTTECPEETQCQSKLLVNGVPQNLQTLQGSQIILLDLPALHSKTPFLKTSHTCVAKHGGIKLIDLEVSPFLDGFCSARTCYPCCMGRKAFISLTL